MPHKVGNGAIFGILSEDGVAKTGFPVTLLDRTTGKRVGRQYTDDNGGFVFNGLNTETDDYQVIGQDEDGETYKNAVIRDRIKPVPGYQGATYWGNWRYLANQIGILASYEGQTGFNYLEDTLSGTIQDYPAMRRRLCGILAAVQLALSTNQHLIIRLPRAIPASRPPCFRIRP